VARLKILTARVAGITSVLTNLEAEAARVGTGAEGERAGAGTGIQATNCIFYSTILHQAMVNQASAPAAWST